MSADEITVHGRRYVRTDEPASCCLMAGTMALCGRPATHTAIVRGAFYFCQRHTVCAMAASGALVVEGIYDVG